ncbi:MAG: hypothetical protein COV74_03240 [Candidatus Omnitrophica bacterium CG11_big_fil_rev_8_21_14_0_20_45_26]|uniref:Glycosyl transferase family 1 domain-containing protein n=1 Tax=Candidatus Abzuiibacterium crystallinum TaxID=1974748 RepID=A0A2H0LQZ6_9BACT|nr:MAG: hypothetical protein COV74_03240 [Candidatus Omnitrophica bacterium CG11_big_fil_rev_8_21_14_0_20_45_26]PIW64689.1 MAG: hypothetical protein COW12_05265 [Candidatus Omnitrophica bacterium CG12_big_fil_rev_8_21_14_0_65_45_16]
MMFLLCNPRELAAEQYAMLDVIPTHLAGQVYFISNYPCPPKKKDITHLPVKCITLRWVALRGFLYPMWPYAAVRRDQTRNVLLIHDEIFSTTMLHALFAKLFCRSKVVIFCAENLKFSFLQTLLGRFFARCIDSALCANREAVTRAEQMGVKKAFVCPLPVSNTQVEVNYKESVKRIGFVGRLIHEKGIDVLCEAMKHFPELEFNIYGNGYLVPEIKQTQFNYKGPFDYSSEALDKVFNDIDVLVVPSLSVGWWKEQFGRVIVEAMDRGVIVIGSNSGAIPEVIGDEHLIFQENSAEAIVAKIKHLCSLKREEVLELSKAMKDRFEERFSKRVIREVIEAVVKGVR